MKKSLELNILGFVLPVLVAASCIIWGFSTMGIYVSGMLGMGIVSIYGFRDMEKELRNSDNILVKYQSAQVMLTAHMMMCMVWPFGAVCCAKEIFKKKSV